MAFKKADDDHHWDFLEEIEAPMWVDLTIESNAFNQDSNDKWFLLSHPFHQCSASQLKVAFSQSNKGLGNADFDLQEQSSPKLPSSVSRSRGKHYRSRKWGIENMSLLSNKGHPIETLGANRLKAGSGSVQEVKLKSSCNVSKGYSSSTVSKDHESNSTESTITKNSKTISCRNDLRKSLHSVMSKAGESNLSSEVLSVMRATLRKSCVTRQASRVEIKDGTNVNSRKSSSSKSSIGSSSNLTFDVMNKDGRNVNSRKSSSSKSSVGSSSNLGYDVMSKELTRRERTDRTPDSRNVAGISQAANNREKSNISRAPNAKLSSRTSYCTNPKGGKIVIAKAAHPEAANSKLICQPTNRKALVPHRVNEQGPATAAIKDKDKLQVSRVNRCLADEKENALGRKVVDQDCGGRKVAVVGMARGQRMKQSEARKVGRTGLVGPKGKSSELIEGVSSRKVIHKVHFR